MEMMDPTLPIMTRIVTTFCPVSEVPQIALIMVLSLMVLQSPLEMQVVRAAMSVQVVEYV